MYPNMAIWLYTSDSSAVLKHLVTIFSSVFSIDVGERLSMEHLSAAVLDAGSEELNSFHD